MKRTAIAQWRFKQTVPKKILTKYGHTITGTGEKGKTTDIPIEQGDSPVDANYIIELQKDKIDNQKQEITELKELLNGKQAESTHWDTLEYDFQAHVKISRDNGMLGRKITYIDTLTPFMDILGYTKEETAALWSVGTLYSTLAEHPIDTIIEKQTQIEMRKIANSLPVIFDSLKHMIGHHYIPFACAYIAKNGTIVPAITYNKIIWLQLEIKSKVKFFATVE